MQPFRGKSCNSWEFLIWQTNDLLFQHNLKTRAMFVFTTPMSHSRLWVQPLRVRILKKFWIIYEIERCDASCLNHNICETSDTSLFFFGALNHESSLCDNPSLSSVFNLKRLASERVRAVDLSYSFHSEDAELTEISFSTEECTLIAKLPIEIEGLKNRITFFFWKCPIQTDK